MVIALGDRSGMQMGWWDKLSQPLPETGQDLHLSFVGGDLLRAYKRGDSFVLENNGKAGPNTGCCANNSQGPGYGEFYNEDFSIHQEAMQGGLALRPGSGEVIGVVMDPNTAQAAGTRTWNNTTGAVVRSVRLVNSDNYPRLEYDPASFGKAGSMGDIELMSDIPRYQETSTRIWDDVDGDGIQDPDEPGKAGVQVVLYDLAGNAVATATTDANGVVVFMANTDPRLQSTGVYSTAGSIPTNTTVISGLVAGQQYVLRVPMSQPVLANNQASPTSSTGVSAVPTAIDSDGVRINSNGSTIGGFTQANFTWPGQALWRPPWILALFRRARPCRSSKASPAGPAWPMRLR